MMRLDDLEQQFQRFVLEGAGGIEIQVVGTGHVPVETRLAVYSEAYRARLVEALENNYPVLAKVLSADDFAALGNAYSDRHRSAHFSIRWYGDRLAEFLKSDDGYNKQPLLAELAAWEWAMTLAFDAENLSAVTRADLAEVAPEEWAGLTFQLHPSVQLLSLRTNAVEVWRAVNKEDEDAPSLTLPRFAEEGNEEAWVVWRKGLDTRFQKLSAIEARTLRLAAEGETFAAICESLADDSGESAAQQAAMFLAQWIDEELLIQPREPSSTPRPPAGR